MTWKFDNPLGTLTTDDQNASAKKLWNEETLGGITEDNKRLPHLHDYLPPLGQAADGRNLCAVYRDDVIGRGAG